MSAYTTTKKWICEQTVLLHKISSVRREVCVNTGRLTDGLLCTQITREKTEGEATKSIKDNSRDGPGFCNYKYNKKPVA